MGLSNVLVFVQTQTLQTVPFESGIILTIHPINQEFCGVEDYDEDNISEIEIPTFCVPFITFLQKRQVLQSSSMPKEIYIEFAPRGDTY